MKYSKVLNLSVVVLALSLGAAGCQPRPHAPTPILGRTGNPKGTGDTFGRETPVTQLPPDQKALISALKATGKPVIVVVIAGRPVGLGSAAESAAGVIMAYQGSTEAGKAIADVIFGDDGPARRVGCVSRDGQAE